MKQIFTKFTILFLLPFVTLSEDYYQLLGIKKNAENRDIRKAFKKLALKYHPDKNSEDDAHEKFLKINKAYEVLKDEDLRKKYDLYGEDGIDGTNKNQKYQSWSYYNDDFGIYDDDKEIVTLDYGDFKRNVLESSDIWFINFYSPRCGHCHDLAPIWRRLAVMLEGVVRIGAVNCQEEFMLCRQQGITGYPTLNLYTLQQGTVKFQGRKEEENILNFLVSFLPDRMVELWEGNLNKFSQLEKSNAWLVVFCEEAESCMNNNDKRLLGAMLDGLVNLGSVDCNLDKEVCDKLRGSQDDASILFFSSGLEDKSPIRLESSVDEFKNIAEEVLKNLPDVTKLNKESFDEMKNRLKNDIGPSWLIHFVNGDIGDELHYKKISAFIPRQRLAKIDCSDSDLTVICRDLYISKFPSFALFKLGGGWELHYGKDNIEDVVQFTRVSSQARTMKTLTASDFPDIITSGQPVIIDFFAPWCPPCMNFLPEFRKASTMIGGQVAFGTVDCTIHSRVCNQHNIRAYPSTVFFNNSKPHKFQGNHNPQDVADFVLDVLRPSVIKLDKDNFEELVGSKTEDQMWLVDFYAPWCGPCKQLAPEWRKLSKMLEKNPDVQVGQVDCVANEDLCYRFGVQAYPAIRMYPMDSKGYSRYIRHQQYHRDAESLHTWVQSQLPSYVDNVTPYLFEHDILDTNQPWLLMFFAPWCSHCTRFMPQFEEVAMMLRGKVKVGKVNCEKYVKMCNKAAVRAYPTLRYYRGHGGEGEQYTSKDIKERNADTIVMIVKQMQTEANDDIKPVIDESKRPETEGSSEQVEIPNDDNYEDDETNFVYYDDIDMNMDIDEEGANYHDEL